MWTQLKHRIHHGMWVCIIEQAQRKVNCAYSSPNLLICHHWMRQNMHPYSLDSQEDWIWTSMYILHVLNHWHLLIRPSNLIHTRQLTRTNIKQLNLANCFQLDHLGHRAAWHRACDLELKLAYATSYIVLSEFMLWVDQSRQQYVALTCPSILLTCCTSP